MNFSRSKDPAIYMMCRGLMLVGLLFTAFSCRAEISPATNAASSAPLVQDVVQGVAQQNGTTAESSSASTGQATAAEPVTPFYAKPGSSQSAIKPAPTVGSGSHLLSVTLGLLAIIGLIFALSLFVKRFGSGTFSANSQLKIISSMPLGTRERIVLIDAGGQQLLLGITPTNINTLHVFADPVVVDNKQEIQSDFSRKLMAILQQKPSSPSSNNRNDSAAQG